MRSEACVYLVERGNVMAKIAPAAERNMYRNTVSPAFTESPILQTDPGHLSADPTLLQPCAVFKRDGMFSLPEQAMLEDLLFKRAMLRVQRQLLFPTNDNYFSLKTTFTHLPSSAFNDIYACFR